MIVDVGALPRGRARRGAACGACATMASSACRVCSWCRGNRAGASSGSKVRARINRKAAQTNGAGTVKLRLTLSPTGALLSVAVVGSAGPALDAAALKAVKSAAPFPRAPKGLNEASYSFSLPITFAG